MTRLRRNLFVSVVGLLLLVAIGVAVIYSLLRSDPSWYQAVVLTEQEQIAGQNRLVDRLAALRNDVGQTQVAVEEKRQKEWPTFEVEITENEVNGFLMRWADTDPRVRTALQELQEPHVRFLEDRIELAGRSVSMDALLSIELTVTQTPEGPLVTLGRPWAGRMPLSRSLIIDPATPALAKLREGDPVRLPAAVIDSAQTLIAGEPTVPVIALHTSLNSLLETRVEKLTIEEGVLKATLRPTGAAK